jgi:hypothetical protein
MVAGDGIICKLLLHPISSNEEQMPMETDRYPHNVMIMFAGHNNIGIKHYKPQLVADIERILFWMV